MYKYKIVRRDPKHGTVNFIHEGRQYYAGPHSYENGRRDGWWYMIVSPNEAKPVYGQAQLEFIMRNRDIKYISLRSQIEHAIDSFKSSNR